MYPKGLMSEGLEEKERQGKGKRDKIILYYIRIKICAQVGFFTNLSLMTNTATLNTSNKNTNNN